MRKSVCVVGSGASGLPSIHWCKMYGFDVKCFEASDAIGGLWRYKPFATNEPSVMRGTVINTSKEMTAYSDFPPPPEAPNYMHNAALYEYMKDYAVQKGLMEHIKLKHKVINIERARDYAKTGKWEVTYKDEEDNEVIEEFDGVLLATGHHWKNNIPAPWPGQDKFQGKVIHSHDYKSVHGYDDKTVIVVGIGNSGCDVACELARCAKQVYLVTRRGTWVFNKTYDKGQPFDMVLNNRFANNVFKKCLSYDRFCRIFEKGLNNRFDHKKFGLEPKHRLFSAHPTISDELPNRIMAGTVKIKPQIKEFMGNTVIFEDGTMASDVDEVICCTGYRFDFPLVEGGKLIPVKNNQHEGFYKCIFPVQAADKNTLAVIGLIQPWGSIMPISEMQARLFCAHLSGEVQFPPEEEILNEVREKQNEVAARYVESPRHTIQIDYVPYMDELASMMKCHPEEWKYLFSDPQLFYSIFFGPCTPYIYRLKGPQQWSGAREAVVDVWDRVDAAYANGKKTVCNHEQIISIPVLTVIFVIILILSHMFF